MFALDDLLDGMLRALDYLHTIERGGRAKIYQRLASGPAGERQTLFLGDFFIKSHWHGAKFFPLRNVGGMGSEWRTNIILRLSSLGSPRREWVYTGTESARAFTTATAASGTAELRSHWHPEKQKAPPNFRYWG